MSVFVKEHKLHLSEKLSRLATRLRDPEWRRYGGLLLSGKALGVATVLLLITVISGLFFTHVYAQTAAPEVKAADIVNPVNTAWVLVAAFLVFGMQVGFTMLEAGFCRSRETVNVLVECVVDTCLCGLLFYADSRLCSAMAMDSSAITGSFCRAHRLLMRAQVWRSWPCGFSSSLLPIPAQLSPRVR